MSRFPARSLRSTPTDIAPIVLAIIAVSTIARLLFATGFDYGIDEAYAVSVARTFQWSFFDHPPIAFWMAGIIEPLFGSHAPHWLVRLPFVLAFSGTLYLNYALGRRLFSAEAGLWGMILLAVAPFFFASAGSWIVPDGPVDLFLAASAVLLARILFDDDLSPEETDATWILLGVAFGLAALSKYHAFLFAVGAVLFIVATPHRRQLMRPAPWLAGLIALVLISPVIWWNASHGWISIAFQSGRSHVEGGLYPVHILQTLAGQAAYLWPWTLVIAAYALIRALASRPAWLGEPGARQKAWFLGSLALPAILLFTILPLFGSRGLPHWPMPGWLFAFPLAGAMLAEARARGRRWPTWLAGSSAGLLALAAVVVVAILQSPTVAGWLLRTPGMLDGRGIVTPLITEAADWKGLGRALADRDLVPKPNRFVVALKWHEAARISAELGAGPVVTVFDVDPRGFAFLTDQRTLVGEDAVIVTDWRPALTVDEDMKPYFESVDQPELITLLVAGGIPKTLSVTHAHKLVKPFPLPYGPTAGPGK